MTGHTYLTPLQKERVSLQRQVELERVRADKAEQALRTIDRQFALTRDRLARAEAHLRSLGHEVVS